MSKDKKLNTRQALFVAEYVIDWNATRAALAAGYSEKTATNIGAENLRKPYIQREIQETLNARLESAEVKAVDVLKAWASIAFADAGELMEMRRVCCRYCHGTEHRYQFTPAEYEREYKVHLQNVAVLQATNKPAPEWDEQGGIGYDRRKPIYSECPECHGLGETLPFFKDTRTLSPEAKRLFAGIKVGKDGMTTLTHSQEGALDKIARHLGMFKDEKKIDLTSGGQPIQAAAPPVTAEQIREAVKSLQDAY